MKKIVALIVLAGAIKLSFSTDVSEKGVATSPLTTYAGGIGAGVFRPLNDELKDSIAANLFKFSFVNTIYFKENVNLFMDLDWFGPGGNFGAHIGLDFFLSGSMVRPFAGIGIGANYFNKGGKDFADNFGPSATFHLGILLDVSDNLQVQIRAPYHFIATKVIDHGAGFDVGLLFSDKFRRVKKFDYNKKK